MGKNEWDKPTFTPSEVRAQRQEILNIAAQVRSRDPHLADHLVRLSHGKPEALLDVFATQVPRAHKIIRKMADPDKHDTRRGKKGGKLDANRGGDMSDGVVFKSGPGCTVVLLTVGALGAASVFVAERAAASDAKPQHPVSEIKPTQLIPPTGVLVDVSSVTSSNLRTAPFRSPRS